MPLRLPGILLIRLFCIEYNQKLFFISTRPAFAPIYANQYSQHGTSSMAQTASVQWAGSNHQFSATQYHSGTSGIGATTSGAGVGSTSVGNASGTTSSHRRGGDADTMASGNGGSSRKEKRQYKKRKHKTQQRDKPYPSPGDFAQNRFRTIGF